VQLAAGDRNALRIRPSRGLVVQVQVQVQDQVSVQGWRRTGCGFRSRAAGGGNPAARTCDREPGALNADPKPEPGPGPGPRSAGRRESCDPHPTTQKKSARRPEGPPVPPSPSEVPASPAAHSPGCPALRSLS